MRKKTRYRSRLRDTAVALLCLLTAAFFLYLFWRDLNASSVRTDKSSIATISFKHKIAQRKYEDRVVWERMSQGAPLYNGDIIRTADLAQAIIEFSDGTVLDLYENTMIQIYYSEGEGLQISVDGGDIQVDSAANSAVSVKLDDGSTVSVAAGSSLSARSDASGATSVEVKSGQATLTTESGQTASLSYGQSVSVDGAGIQVNPVTVTSIARETRVLNMDGESNPVTLAWKVSGGDDAQPVSSVVVETSRTKDFSVIESSSVVSGDASSVTLDTSDGGTLYWRVYAEGVEDKPAEGKITVENISPVQQVAPAPDAEFRYRTANPRIYFRWEGNSYAERYRLVVSSTPDMQGAEVSTEVSETFAATSSLGEGTWYWQVTPYYSVNGLGYDGESAVRSFTVIRNEQIQSPQLSVPAQDAVLTYRDAPSATFIWKSELKDSTYDLTVSRTQDMSQVVFQTTTDALRVQKDFAPGELADGTYYWQVVRSSGDPDDVAPRSDVRSFSVAQYVPQENRLLYPPESFSVETAKLPAMQFAWKLGDDYSGTGQTSVIQFARDQGFASVAQELTVDGTTLTNVMLPVGTYWWRMGVRSDGGTGAFTAARRLTVLQPLATPTVITPAAGGELVTYSGSPVSIAWSAVAGADVYNVRVYDANDSLVFQDAAASGTTARMTLSPGQYTVKVQAVAQETDTSPLRSGDNTERQFTVREPEPIRLVSPAPGQEVVGLSALRQQTEFTWRTGADSAVRYEFVLSRRQDDGTMRVVDTQTVTGTRASVERLTAGTYSWRVNASTAQGLPINSAASTFTVTPVPTLQKATLSTPSQNLVMDAQYLRRNRTITFSWQAVAGATEYTFALYRRNANGTLSLVQQERGLTGTSVRLRELSLLDVGDFVWYVTAYGYASDGYEERRSEASEGRFKVDFEAPTRIETVDPGRLYVE